MKRFLYSFSFLLIATVLHSCDKEWPDFKKPSVQLNYKAEWSTDLLEFVTPVVYYTDADGEHETELPASMLTMVVPEYTLNGEAVKDDPYFCWSKAVILKTFNTTNTVIVKYNRNANAQVDNDKTYSFRHRLYLSTAAVTQNNSIQHYLFSNPEVTIGEDFNKYHGENATSYIEKLCDTPDSITVAIDENGNITFE